MLTIGKIPIGDENPIRIQTMTNTPTRDIEATVHQCIRVAEAGAEFIRITVPSIGDAKYLSEIHTRLRALKYMIPIVADVHFNPKIAETVASIVEKVRINPGNYSDTKKFENHNYTDKEYSAELTGISTKLIPLLEICRKNNTALRIGVNHGSLSDRIVSKFGDTPTGMVESAMEFLRICRNNSFNSVVISMKASNTMIMVQATRLLMYKMMEEDFVVPLHLGVTEAGEGEDGRIKSAAGISALLLDGIGDTIRVSLTEDPEAEIPVARKITSLITEKKNLEPVPFSGSIAISPFEYNRRNTYSADGTGNGKVPVVIADLTYSKKINTETLGEVGWIFDRSGEKWSFTDQAADYLYIPDNILVENLTLPKPVIADFKNLKNQSPFSEKIIPILRKDEYIDPGVKIHSLKFLRICFSDLSKDLMDRIKNDEHLVIVIEPDKNHGFYGQRGLIFELLKNGLKTPVVIKNDYAENSMENFQIRSASDTGIFFLDGLADGIWLSNKDMISLKKVNETAFSILQSTRARITKTEFISCPSCGRTNFNLVETSAKIREKTGHLKGLKIGIMGCIVNGLGEMADADYGYVGTGIGKVNLYKSKQLIKKNIPENEAVNELIALIRENGDWLDP